MRLKRHHTPEGKLDYIELQHTGVGEGQNFSRRLVERAVLEGWMRLSGDTITLVTKQEDLVYKIRRAPGYYCVHCGERIESDPTGEAARVHVKGKHPGVDSPDPQWPAGYSVTHAYECVLDAKQQEKYKALPIGQKKGG